MDYSILTNDFINGPLNTLVAPLLAIGADQAVADAYNSTTNAGAGVITLPTLTKQQFMTGLSAALPGFIANPALQAKYQFALNYLTGFPDATIVDMSAGSVALGILELFESDSLLTPTQVTTINQRTGSRAEVLYGANTTLTAFDIAQAR